VLYQAAQGPFDNTCWNHLIARIIMQILHMCDACLSCTCVMLVCPAALLIHQSVLKDKLAWLAHGHLLISWKI